jgi:membrane fusion protein (multidrug efflux system)
MVDTISSMTGASMTGASMTGPVARAAEPALVRPRKRDLRGALRRALLVGAALAALGGGAWYANDWWTTGRFIESTDDAYVGGDVTVIAPKVAGFIDSVAVTDNQAVRAGDLLIKLDDRDHRALLARAEAVVAGARATLANLEATRRLQEQVIAEARAGVTVAEAEVVRSRYDAVRYRELASNQFASAQRQQQADADHQKATANATRTRAAVAAAERQLEVIDTQTLQAEAALAQAVAERDLASLNLSYTELRAPIDGTVGNRSAKAGAYASIGSQLIAIVPSNGLWVDANFKESQLAHMQPGMPATIRADVLPGRVFTGHVESLAPATGAQFSVLPPENATGNFTKIVQRVPVRIRLDGDGPVLGRLRPGLSVTANVDQR